MKTTYRVKFEFATQGGDLVHRTVDVVADSEWEAANDAWRDRVHLFGLMADVAIGCRVVS